jgi:hypothetical protein
VTSSPALSRRALGGLLLTAVVALSGCAGRAPEATDSSSGGGSSAPAARTITVTVTHGKAHGDTGRIPVPLGTPVRLVVTSDTADEVHLHGYDIEKELAPGKPTTLTFVANVPGVFEVELHELNIVIVHLQVG